MRLLLFIFAICLFLCGTASAQYKQYDSGLENYKEGRYDQAISLFDEYFTKTIRDKKIDAEVYYYRGLSYYKKAQYNEAIPDLKGAIELNHANTGNIHWFIAKCRERLGEHPLSLAEYNNAINILKTDKAAHAKLLFERSQIYLKLGNNESAFDDLSLAASLNPDDLSVKQELDAVARTLRAKGNAVADKKTEPATKTSDTKKQPVSKEEQKKLDDAKKTEDAKRLADAKKLEDAKKIEDARRLAEAKRLEDEKKLEDARKIAEAKKAADDKKKEDAQASNRTTTKGKLFEKKEKDGKEDHAKEEMQPVTPSPLEAMYANEKRYALVIGNGTYPKEIGALRNPVNDATDMAKELRASKFEVDLLINVTYVQMREAMRKFNEKLSNGPKDETVGLFYYAGHGVHMEQENYLVPVDARVEFEDDIPRMCFPVQRMVLANMERSNSRMNIVVLDACRNNPFPATNRSISQGLGEMQRARGSFIAYATAPGSVASDGTGRNGLYTQELLKALKKPGLTIEQVFKEVRANVLRHSGDKQNTWDSSNIIGEFYFKF